MSTTEVRQAGADAPVHDPAAPPNPAPPAQARGAGWTARRIGTLVAPAVVFLGIREFGLIVLAWMSDRNSVSVPAALRSWDGQWFLEIARGGYDGVSPNLLDANYQRHPETPLAFFPGYPTAVRWVGDAGSWLGVGLLAAALTVTIVSGVACAFGLARLGTRIAGGSRRAGLALVALFAASPMAIVLSMAYSEALFCAFAVWALVGVLERRWVLAGVCCALAGLVRPTAAALVLTVGLAVVAVVITRKDGWRPLVGGMLAPTGLIGYLAWVGARTGEWNGWFTLQQRGWGSGFDGGVATWRFSLDVLADGRSVLEVATVGLIVCALLLLAIGIAQRLEWPLLVYAAGVLAMDLASNGLMNSKVRLMIPAFTLLIPVALALAKRRTSTMVIVLGAVAVASSWFGAYSVTSWLYAI